MLPEQLSRKESFLVGAWPYSGEYHMTCHMTMQATIWVCHRCMKSLDDLKMETADQQLGVDIVRKALRMPLYTIAKNAGADPSLVVAQVMGSETQTEGYDALKDRYVDMIHEGIYCSLFLPLSFSLHHRLLHILITA